MTKFEFEWIGEKEAFRGAMSFGHRQKFKIPDGRVFVASGAHAAFTGFEVAIFSESGEWLMDPVRLPWDKAIHAFLKELYEKEALVK